MPDWIAANAGLWGLLALPIMVLAAIPTLAQLWATVRDRGTSPEEMRASLVATQGRVSGDTRRSTLTGAGEILPLSVATPRGAASAIEYGYERISEGLSLLIVGEPGSGKSQTLADLHRISYQRALKHSGPLVEVIPFGELANKTRFLKYRKSDIDVLQSATQVIASRYQLGREAVRRLIIDTRLIIAFDGLDELADDSRQAVLSGIAEYAMRRPVILTSRPFASQRETSIKHDDTLSSLAGSRVERVYLNPINWNDVSAELVRLGIPVPHASRIAPGARLQLCNPLQFQALVLLWRRQAMSEPELAELLRKPDSLLARLISGDGPASHDRALRLAGVLLADHVNNTNGSFRVYPVDLGGYTFRVAKVLTIVSFVVYGFHRGSLVTAPAIACAVLLSSPYPNSIWTNRAINGWTGRLSMRTVLGSAMISYIIVHACRIISWSLQARALSLGTWKDLFDPYWVSAVVCVALFLVASPFGRDTHTFAWKNMERHSWPQIGLFGFATLFYLALPGSSSYVLGLWVYLGAGCLYWLVGISFAWLITRTAPWRWDQLVDRLVERGVLTRDGTRLRFVHATLRLQVVRSLARDPKTPDLLWKVFSADWPDLLIGQHVGQSMFAGDAAFERRINRLARRDAWSVANVNQVVCYYQWIALRGKDSLLLIRRHLRLLPRSSLKVLLPDALDRVGDASGLTEARAQIGRTMKSGFAIHWLLRVIERYDSYPELMAAVTEIQARASCSEEITDLLNARRLKYLVGQMSGDGDAFSCVQHDEIVNAAEPADLALLALEQRPPQLDAAESQLSMMKESALAMARVAQVKTLRGEQVLAAAAADRAMALLPDDLGYDDTIEIMLTLAQASANREAVSWLERAAASGLRLRGRNGLRRNLGVGQGNMVDAIFGSIPTHPVRRPAVDGED